MIIESTSPPEVAIVDADTHLVQLRKANRVIVKTHQKNITSPVGIIKDHDVIMRIYTALLKSC
jgi:hypothetical protein